MRSRRRSVPKRLVRALAHAVFVESRQGRAAEIAAWSNGACAVAIAIGAFALAWPLMHGNAAWLALISGALTLLLLRLALTNRVTVWIASALGTLTVAAAFGSLTWLFAHVIEIPSLPPVAAVLGGLLGALAPAWSYAQLARRRADAIPDSLMEPVSAPFSR